METCKTYLRIAAEDDAEWLYRLHRDPETLRFEDEPLWPSETFALRWIRRHQTVHRHNGILMILRATDQQWLGLCQWRIEQGQMNIGYRLLRDFWGQGLAYDAVGQLLLLLHQQGWQQVNARVAVRNLRSRRLLQRLGFQQMPALLMSRWLDYRLELPVVGCRSA